MIYLRELTQYLSQGLWTDFSRSAGAARQSGQTNTHCRLLSFDCWGKNLFYNDSTDFGKLPGNPFIFNPPGIFIAVKQLKKGLNLFTTTPEGIAEFGQS